MSAGRPSRGFDSLSVRGKLAVVLGVQLLVLTAGCLSFVYAQRELTKARVWTVHTYQGMAQIEVLHAEVCGSALMRWSGFRFRLRAGTARPLRTGSAAP